MIEMVCLLERDFPTSFFDIQVHLLVHLVEEISIAGPVHTRWMFYLERFMKVLKGFVRQKARPEGSIAEGWLIQESLFYITEIISQLHPASPKMWCEEEDERVKGEVPQGNGVEKRLSSQLKEKIDTFILYNCGHMEKWTSRYEEAKKERNITLKRRRNINRRRRRALENDKPLEPLPSKCTREWVFDTMLKASENGEEVTELEWEFVRGCAWKVSVVLSL